MYTHTLEYYSATKKETLLFVTTWMNLEGIMLSEIREKDKLLHDLTYMENLKTNKQNNKLIDLENRLVVARGWECGMGTLGKGGQNF